MSSIEHLSLVERVFGYIPNGALALAGVIAYAIVGVALSLRVFTSKAWWGLCLPIGSFCEAVGFTIRYISKNHPDSNILLAIQQLFIICAPAAFLAFNYIVYGRLISSVGPQHSIVKPQKVAKIFVISDIFTFLIQAGGGGLSTAEKTANVGEKVILVGLILQAISYGFFCILLVKSHISIKSSDAFKTHNSCIVLIWVLYFSSALISLRCIYRVVEFSQGRHGYLLTHEVFLYALDTLPLLLAIIVYIPWWPTKYIKYDKYEGAEMAGVPRP